MISSIFCNLETLQCNRIPQRFIVIHVTSVITWCFLQTSANVWWLWLEYLLATRHNTYIKFIIQVSCNILVLLCPDVIRQTEWMKSLTTGCRGVILYSFQYVRRENTVNSSGKRKILQSIGIVKYGIQIRPPGITTSTCGITMSVSVKVHYAIATSLKIIGNYSISYSLGNRRVLEIIDKIYIELNGGQETSLETRRISHVPRYGPSVTHNASCANI